MIRAAIALLLTTFYIAIPAQAGVSPPIDLKEWQTTCKHYDNRARFLPRSAPLPPLVVMADSCHEALYHMTTPGTSNALRHEAAVYLTQLTTLRRTIIAMNMDRVTGQVMRNGRALISGTQGVVSEFGEYLIASELGVLDAYQHWIRNGGTDLERQARLPE